jgi:Ca2+/Na+ antiporter
VVLAAFAVLAFPLLARGRRIRRTQGLIMLAAYFAYILWTYRSGA